MTHSPVSEPHNGGRLREPKDFFQITERNSTVWREVAGLTTFNAMSYILAVNPAILSATGMNIHSLIITTALASMIGTLIMALWSIRYLSVI